METQKLSSTEFSGNYCQVQWDPRLGIHSFEYLQMLSPQLEVLSGPPGYNWKALPVCQYELEVPSGHIWEASEEAKRSCVTSRGPSMAPRHAPPLALLPP